MSDPVAYLVRVGSVDRSFPLLSDPPLSRDGVEQAERVREYFFASGIGHIRSTMTASGLQFADIVSSGFTPIHGFPQIIICDTDLMNVVSPGGIIEVHQEGEEYRYVPVLGEIPAAEQN